MLQWIKKYFSKNKSVKNEQGNAEIEANKDKQKKNSKKKKEKKDIYPMW